MSQASSLPDRLDTRTIFGACQHQQAQHYVNRNHKERSKSPSTPPPSTCSSPLPSEMFNNRDLRNEENLVHISILNVEKSHPDLQTVYEGINKFANVDFNSLDIKGQLGNFCIKDLTSYGFLYRDRFLCRGEQILKFKIFKFGQKDEELKREHDIEVILKMASISYVHTQRFWSVLMTFFTEFQQLQETLNSHRVSSQRKDKAGQSVGFVPPAWGTGRGSRIKLNIEADSPMLVLPMSSSSTQV